MTAPTPTQLVRAALACIERGQPRLQFIATRPEAFHVLVEAWGMAEELRAEAQP